MELTDKEIMDAMPKQFHEDLANVCRLAAYGPQVEQPGLYRVILNTGALAFARAAIAAHEAALAAERPAPAVGPEWRPCVKLPITVHVRDQRPGEAHVSTREGVTPVRPDDLIMRGVQGEEYPIGRDLFNRTYRLGAADPGGPAPAPAADGEREELAQWLDGEAKSCAAQFHDRITRAAALLREASPQPVPVADRPWERPGWCDAEGRCWLLADGDHHLQWRLCSVEDYQFTSFASGMIQVQLYNRFGTMVDRFYASQSLPHWAIPIPHPPQDREVGQ